MQLHCPICVERIRFVGEEALRSHLAQVHFKCRPYPCSLCAGTERFPTETSLRHHVESQHGVLKYQIHYAPTKEELSRLGQIDAQVRLAVEKREGQASGGEELQMVGARVTVDPGAQTPKAVKMEEMPVESHQCQKPVAGKHGGRTGSSGSSGSLPREVDSSPEAPPIKREEPQGVDGRVDGESHHHPARRQPLKRRHSDHHHESNSPRPPHRPHRSATVQCRLCQEEIPNLHTRRLTHANMVHLRLPLHQCTVEGCGYISSSYRDHGIQRHFEEWHARRKGVGDWREYVDSRVDHYQRELEKQDRRCFGDWEGRK